MPTRNSRFDLNEKVVVITGGGKGIGKIYAQEFARAGGRVVAADIDGSAAQDVATGIGAEGHSGSRSISRKSNRLNLWRPPCSIVSGPSTCSSTTRP